jgi:hypothetical protein
MNDSPQNTGWFVASLLGMWGWGFRLIFGRRLKANDLLETKVDSLSDRVSHIEGKLGITHE